MLPIKLPHTITVTPFIGNSAYGPRYSDPVEYPARVEFGGLANMGLRAILGTMAQEISPAARIFMNPGARIPPNSKITWIDPMGETHEFTATEVAPMDGPNGPSHIEIIAT